LIHTPPTPLNIRICSTIGIGAGFFGNRLTTRRKISGEHMVSREGFSPNKTLLFDKEESDGYVFYIKKEEFLFMSMDTKSTNTKTEDN
jgi:hypothetical protein